jgi:hypothetical protein
MARDRVGDDVMNVRFGDGTFARIDKLGGNRSGFIRAAVASALDAADGGRKKKSFVSSGKKGDRVAVVAATGRSADQAVVLDLVRSKHLTSHQASDFLGWLGMRYANAEKALLRAGSIAVVDGALVATDA